MPTTGSFYKDFTQLIKENNEKLDKNKSVVQSIDYMKDDFFVNQCNVRLDFKGTKEKNAGAGNVVESADVAFSIFGYLSENGLSLQLNNDFSPVGELANTVLNTVNELNGVAQLAFEQVGGMIGNSNITKATNVRGYIKPIFIFNSPMMWMGTKPIGFQLNFNSIAGKKEDIMVDYYNVLRSLSPSFGSKGDGDKKWVSIAGASPMLIDVHYFPSQKDADGDMQLSSSSDGIVVFKDCLCESVTMDIKGPFNHDFMPIIGNYNFSLKTSRIMDRKNIEELFGVTNGNKSNSGIYNKYDTSGG